MSMRLVKMREDWARLDEMREFIYAAKTLPERFKLAIDYNAECCAFVEEYRHELAAMIKPVQSVRPALPAVKLDRAA